jgi:hypothetical protein
MAGTARIAPVTIDPQAAYSPILVGRSLIFLILGRPVARAVPKKITKPAALIGGRQMTGTNRGMAIRVTIRTIPSALIRQAHGRLT